MSNADCPSSPSYITVADNGKALKTISLGTGGTCDLCLIGCFIHFATVDHICLESERCCFCHHPLPVESIPGDLKINDNICYIKPILWVLSNINVIINIDTQFYPNHGDNTITLLKIITAALCVEGICHVSFIMP